MANKGGSGKTTTAINLSSGLVRCGEKVVLIDTDPQRNATIASGFPREQAFRRTISDSLITGDCPPVFGSLNGYSLIPSSIKMAKIENDVNDAEEMVSLFKGQLEKLEQKFEGFFDFVVFDTTPSIYSKANIAILLIADYVIIPMEPEYYALEGLRTLLSYVSNLPATNRPTILGIVFVKNKRRVLYDEIINATTKEYPNLCFNTMIADSIRIPEAQNRGMDIYRYIETYHPEDKHISDDYQEICNETIKRILEHGKQNEK